MPAVRKLIVEAVWDEDARVWVATSEDIPGLVTEAPTFEALVQRVKAVAPELLQENAHLLKDRDAMSDPLEVCVTSSFQMQVADAT